MTGRSAGAIVLALFALTGCAGGPPHSTGGVTMGPLPAAYKGVLPCADCPGIEYRLNLFADHVFELRMTYLDVAGDGRFDDLGTWSVDENGTLALDGYNKSPKLFRVMDDSTLEKLDIEGRVIESDLDYTLTRQDAFRPFEPQLVMRGMYRYQADAGLFRECLTGRQWPVVQEADNAALEEAYLDAQEAPGEPVLVGVEGRLTTRPHPDTGEHDPALVVEEFLNVWPAGSCRDARKN